MADFFDPNTSGLAEFFKGRDRDEIWQWLREEMYTAVGGHEVGHTLGLRHNFAASMDPLNYRPEFWWLENEGDEPIQYWDPENAPSEQFKHRGNEYKYASIMDYGFSVPIEGIHGIGSYDAAAIRFTYGQLLDVFDNRKISIPDPRKYGTFAARCGYNSDGLGLGVFLNAWLTPEWIPKLLSTDAVPQGPCARNYDDSEVGDACDTAIDRIFREFAIRAEQQAATSGTPTSCGLDVDDLNYIFGLIDALPQRANMVYDSRRIATVEEIRGQQVAVLTNPPEYDDFTTTDVDESRDGEDDDGDGVIDDKGYDWSTYEYTVPVPLLLGPLRRFLDSVLPALGRGVGLRGGHRLPHQPIRPGLHLGSLPAGYLLPDRVG